MKTHELKTVAPHFEHVRSGVKRADIRRDDRGFAVGDVLVLREYDPTTDSYSGREIEVRVTHVLSDYEALAPGFVMLSIEPQPSALATARAEAALAERSVCAALVERITEVIGAPGGFVRLFGTDTARAIRARTTPDTLSTDTLAAIAEARGLRVVEPERLAELEAAVMAEREACAAEVSALLDQVQRAIDTTYPTGRALDELVAARTVLQKAAAMIGTRSIGGAR